MSDPGQDLRSESAPVVLFDGECPLCNRSVAFLARHDRTHRLRYAHLQGRFAAAHLPPELRSAARDGSVVLLEPDRGGRVSLRSAAVLRALAHASPAWRMLGWLAAVPGTVPLLDVLYAYVARKRDDWFGRHETCALPDASFRARFLD
ncbi:DCC1-like thiol-disulfide oxidoreductase family protein [Candidatus Binatia bacterium]|nr:DCC1-like thiol-disulfide oxidoreductase family protein [Candidatus Binatia bacterium]